MYDVQSIFSCTQSVLTSSGLYIESSRAVIFETDSKYEHFGPRQQAESSTKANFNVC